MQLMAPLSLSPLLCFLGLFELALGYNFLAKQWTSGEVTIATNSIGPRLSVFTCLDPYCRDFSASSPLVDLSSLKCVQFDHMIDGSGMITIWEEKGITSTIFFISCSSPSNCKNAIPTPIPLNTSSLNPQDDICVTLTQDLQPLIYFRTNTSSESLLLCLTPDCTQTHTIPLNIDLHSATQLLRRKNGNIVGIGDVWANTNSNGYFEFNLSACTSSSCPTTTFHAPYLLSNPSSWTTSGVFSPSGSIVLFAVNDTHGGILVDNVTIYSIIDAQNPKVLVSTSGDIYGLWLSSTGWFTMLRCNMSCSIVNSFPSNDILSDLDWFSVENGNDLYIVVLILYINNPMERVIFQCNVNGCLRVVNDTQIPLPPKPQPTPQTAPQTAPQTTPQTTPQTVPQTVPQSVPQDSNVPSPALVVYGAVELSNTNYSIQNASYYGSLSVTTTHLTVKMPLIIQNFTLSQYSLLLLENFLTINNTFHMDTTSTLLINTSSFLNKDISNGYITINGFANFSGTLNILVDDSHFLNPGPIISFQNRSGSYFDRITMNGAPLSQNDCGFMGSGFSYDCCSLRYDLYAFATATCWVPGVPVVPIIIGVVLGLVVVIGIFVGYYRIKIMNEKEENFRKQVESSA